jgi:hypothetical protein
VSNDFSRGAGHAGVGAAGRDLMGLGVRTRGIGLLGVATLMPPRVPVLAIAISWLRVGSSGLSDGDP